MYRQIARATGCVAILTSAMLAQEPTNSFNLSGEIRSGYVDYGYNSATLDTTAFATVLKVGLQTPSVGGFYAKVMGAGVHDLGTSDMDKQLKSNIFRKDKITTERSNFSILQELFIGYKDSAHEFKIGRNEFVSPMISKDDFYMFANSFESISYTNRQIKNTTINAGYLHKMAGIWDSRSDGSNFRSMSDASMVPAANKTAANDSGIYYAGAEHKIGNNLIKVWDYYAKELYNTLFVQYDYFGKRENIDYNFGVQLMNFKEVGKLSKSTTNIDTTVYAVQLDAKLNNGILFNTSLTKYGSGDGEQYVQGAWGGYVYYTKGFIFHFHESNSFTNALGYKVQLGYDFSKIGVDNLNLNFRYTNFDLDSSHKGTFIGDGNLKFYGAQLKYGFMKNGYFAATYEKGTLDNVSDFNGLRLIGGYRF